MSQNIYMGYVNVFDKYLHWPCVSVNDWDLHEIYMPYIQLLTCTHTILP